MNASELIPPELRDFLAANGSTRIEFDSDMNPEMEVYALKFFPLDELALTSFEIYTHDYYLNHGEPGEDPNMRYQIEGVDLIQDCNDYDPSGLLVYFPSLAEFGCWDCDHRTISIFPKASWSVIEKSLRSFLNSQWYPHLSEQTLLRPWADDRCSEIKAQPSEY